MLQTLSVQPLWIERMHNRAQSGYLTEQQTQIQTAECLSTNYASDDVHDVHICMCYFFSNCQEPFLLAVCIFFLSKCPVRFGVSLSLTCRQMNMWANMNIWIIHYSRRPQASLRICWPVSQLAWECLGIPQRCCEVKSGPLWLGHWTPKAGPRGHSSRLRLA